MGLFGAWYLNFGIYLVPEICDLEFFYLDLVI